MNNPQKNISFFMSVKHKNLYMQIISIILILSSGCFKTKSMSKENPIVHFYYVDITASGSDKDTGSISERFNYMKNKALDDAQNCDPGSTIAVYVTGNQSGKPRLIVSMQTKQDSSGGDIKRSRSQFRAKLDSEFKEISKKEETDDLKFKFSPIIEDIAWICESAVLESDKGNREAAIFALSDGQQYSEKFRWGEILDAKNESVLAKKAGGKFRIPSPKGLKNIYLLYLPGVQSDVSGRRMKEFYESLFHDEWKIENAKVEKCIDVK